MRQAILAIPLLLWALTTAPAGAPINDLPAPIVTRQAVFSIPFTVPAIAASQAPSEVRLLASGDRGAKWQAIDRVDLRTQQLPYKGAFTFRAVADGEYWFAIRTVEQNGQMPQAPMSAPELRVVVDTRPPRLEVTATRGAAGEVLVRWQMVDPNLKPDSLRLDYQTGANPRWQPIAIDTPSSTGRGALTDSATFWPTDAGDVLTIKAEASDAAGNVSVSQARLDLRQSAPAGREPDDERQPLTASIKRGAPRGVNSGAAGHQAQTPDLEPRFAQGAAWPADSRTDLPLGRTQRPNNAGSSPAARSGSGPASQSFNPNASAEAPLEGPALGPTTDGRLRPSGQRPASEPGVESPAAANGGGRSHTSMPGEAGGAVHPPIANRYVPSSGPQGARGAGEGAAAGSTVYFDRASGQERTNVDASPRTARASSFDFELPPGEHLRMVNSKTFELAYDVDSIGRSGIAKVELWMTRDAGRTWSNMGVDSDNRSPFVTSVEDEGVYGYRITVQSGSGLGGRPPQPGDAPELWIGVDLTRPVARLISAEPGAGDRVGEMVIRYEANDALLASRPVALLQSAQPGGPWTTIAAGLDNTGTYSWRFDNTVPDRVYLRLEVRDEAGNVGVFEAADPISLDRVLPQGRLRSVRPVGDSARGGPAATHWQR